MIQEYGTKNVLAVLDFSYASCQTNFGFGVESRPIVSVDPWNRSTKSSGASS